jgi:hypothetical protein
VLLWAALAVLLYAGVTWFQGYVYSEPEAGMFWRAPLAAAVLTLFWAFWGMLDYRSPGTYPAPFEFSTGDERRYEKLEAEKGGKVTAYRLDKSSGEFRDSARRPLPSHPDAIIVEEDGERVRFEPQRDAQGNFKIDAGESLRYIDPSGRVMSEASVGQVTTFRRGLFLGYILLTALHFAAWFACLWLVLRFQSAHALGLAVVFWLVTSLVIMPMVLGRVEAAARPSSAATGPDPVTGRPAFAAGPIPAGEWCA